LVAERAVLTEHGFPVREAHDGAEALRALDIEPPAMIVLDVQMPGIDGPTFARELRTRLRHVPLVILTASPDPKREADRCNAEELGLHPLAVEDARELHERPKADAYDRYYFITFSALAVDGPDTLRTELFSIFAFTDVIVTVRKGDWPARAEVEKRWRDGRLA